MSKQMDRDWIEQEYEFWAKHKVCDPQGQTERCQYVAQLFAEHVLIRVSQMTPKENHTQTKRKTEEATS